MKGIKNIILDLGGVLINLDFKKANLELGNLGLKNSFTKSKQIELFDRLEEGRISDIEFLKEFNVFASTNWSNESIINAWNSILLDFPAERLELVKKFQIVWMVNM